ncbi:hypothetical protein Bbelb_164050 [Branchiostoma belcheri]|nr:hypothetical protein Bbelb_164050 [Branchiostoma belcheri]
MRHLSDRAIIGNRQPSQDCTAAIIYACVTFYTTRKWYRLTKTDNCERLGVESANDLRFGVCFLDLPSNPAPDPRMLAPVRGSRATQDGSKSGHSVRAEHSSAGHVPRRLAI